ncbi:MAG: acetate--CoA ligase family protein [Spirochaetota bacterium]
MNGKRPALAALFNPRQVAVFGSVKQGKMAHQILTQLTAGSFQGSLYAVNPKGESPEEFPQIPGYRSLNAVKGDVDLAVICTPAPVVEQVLDDCGRRQIPAAVIITSGFSEAGNRAGEERLLECARKHGVRLIGPNCAGIMNTVSHFFASIEIRALPGRTAFVTQSGAVGGAVLALAGLKGIGLSKFISFGNRADIGENELLRYLAEDPDTDAIALYVESLQNGRAFMAAAREVTGSKPLLIIKSGRFSSGLRAAGSHTGSMAGSDQVFDSLIRQIGAVRVEGIEEMLDLCYGFNRLPPLKGNRIAIVTNSGGPGILTADRAEELGLDIKETDQTVKDELHSFLPGHCAFTNPIDLTVEGSGENYRRTIEIMLNHGYDGAIAINVATPFLDSESLAAGIAGVAKSREKPVAAVFMAGEIVEKGIQVLEKNKVAHFPTGERTAYVFSKLHTCYTRRPESAPEDQIQTKMLPLKHPMIEPEAVSFLKSEGFHFPEHTFVQSAGECLKAAGRIGFPMVMKVVSPRILHKSDVGGVILDIKDESELDSAFEQLRAKFSDRDFKGVMLYRQAAPALELIAGVKQDPDFGPVILAGAGGIYTELLNDVSLRIAPIDQRQAQEMLSELKVRKSLTGFRGRAALDGEAVAELLASLSRLVLTYPAIQELDFNPVFVFEKGCLIGDARILIKN